MDDLINACNEAVYEYTGIYGDIKRRQIFDDIKFMESDQGWSIPLDKIRDGKKVYYRYSDKNYSIKKELISQNEATLLNETLFILKRFEGIPQFDWIDEWLIRIESTFKLKPFEKAIVSFEQNPYLKGLHFFSDIFNAINNKRVIEVKYQSFKQTSPVHFVIHPYFLKQYNNRWFLFGLNKNINSISNLALDRMIEINSTNEAYIENKIMDFEDYFEDVIGVTVSDFQEAQKILMKVNHELLPYIENKPIHGSQKIKVKNSNEALVEVFLKVNYELISLLLSYGEKIEVIEPEELKNIIKNKAEMVYKKYI